MLWGDVDDGGAGDDPEQLVPEATPRTLAPEVVHPKKAALLEILAKRLHLLVAKPHGSHVGGKQKGAAVEVRMRGEDNRVRELAVGVLRHADGRQLLRPEHQIILGIREIGVPADPAGLARDTPVREPAEREADAAPLQTLLHAPGAAACQRTEAEVAKILRLSPTRTDDEPSGEQCERAGQFDHDTRI